MKYLLSATDTILGILPETFDYMFLALLLMHVLALKLSVLEREPRFWNSEQKTLT